MQICPHCQKNALDKSLYNDNFYCFPKRGGCGRVVPNLEITEEGLDFGYAIQPYSISGSERSELGDLINKLKYWDISVIEKLKIINEIMPVIQEGFSSNLEKHIDKNKEVLPF